jgi:hypothetical protein
VPASHPVGPAHDDGAGKLGKIEPVRVEELPGRIQTVEPAMTGIGHEERLSVEGNGNDPSELTGPIATSTDRAWRRVGSADVQDVDRASDPVGDDDQGVAHERGVDDHAEGGIGVQTPGPDLADLGRGGGLEGNGIDDRPREDEAQSVTASGSIGGLPAPAQGEGEREEAHQNRSTRRRWGEQTLTGGRYLPDHAGVHPSLLHSRHCVEHPTCSPLPNTLMHRNGSDGSSGS